MVNEGKLSSVLSEFARTLITDFPIQGILDRLVERIVEVLPITSAGVTLISAGKKPHYIAASNASALRFERLQTEIGQGPCLLAYESGEAVEVPDLAIDGRFPLFAPAALAAGLAAVFTFPLRHGSDRMGALDLYRETPGELARDDFEAAQTLADVAAAYLLNAQARDEARATSDQFHYNAFHDPLTGLANRLLLQERLEHAAQRAKRSRAKSAILFVDLDRFKQVNDAFGHQTGDELLRAVARRLGEVVRSGETLARLSGDEFVVLCEDVESADAVEALRRRIEAVFAVPFVLSNTELTMTASVGMAFAGSGENISTQLLIKADLAMYQIKRNGGGARLIDLLDARRADPDARLALDLRSALVDDRLDLAYQTIVSVADGSIAGVEALLRWTDPDRGIVEPISMVSAAEQSGLICDIGAWVMERSCGDYERWVRGHPHVAIDLAVNVSPRQVVSQGFVAMVARALERAGTDPTTVVLEITESVFLEDSDRVMRALAALKTLGVRIALDDFGSGYSSLSYFSRLPIDIVKIDRCFITGIEHTPTNRAIAMAVTDLAHRLGITVVAEGVETQAEHDIVRDIGCDRAQGFFYGRPTCASAIGARLAAAESPAS